MTSSTISTVLRCAVLLVVSVKVTGGVAVPARQQPVRDGSQETHTEVESQLAGPHCGGESLLLEVVEARCEVQRSLDRLDDIEDSLKLVLRHIVDERVITQRSLDKLAGIVARRTERSACSNNQCQNGGTCFDENTSFRCACVTGYTGVHCELNVDECLSNPCRNGATCSDVVNGYTCICADGYSGPTCGVELLETLSEITRGFITAYSTGGDYMAFYTDDCRIFAPDQDVTIGKTAASEGLKEVEKDLPQITLEKIVELIPLTEDLAWVNWKGDYLDPQGKITGRYKNNVLWRKVDGVWKMHRAMWNQRPMPE